MNTPISSDNATRLAHRILQPEGWAKPIGYSNGVEARGRIQAVAVIPD